MRKLLTIAGIIATIFAFTTGMWCVSAEAKKKGEVIYSVAAAMYPDVGGEYYGLNMYIEALLGRTQLHPSLKGKMHLKVLDKGMMFSSQEDALTALGGGGIQMTYSTTRFLEQLAPEWKLANIPGFFDSWEHFARTMQTPTWKALHEKMAKENGVTVLKWLFKVADLHIFTDIGPVKTMDDLKGQKIRFPGGEAFARVLKAFGATPISLPYTEVVTALQTHMINGLVTEISGALEYYKLPRYTRYAISYPLGMELICMVVNTNWWNSLNPDARKAVSQIFQRIDVTKFYREHVAGLMKVWADNPKTELLDLSDAEAERWRKTIRSAVKGMIADIDPKYIRAIDASR